MLSALKHRLPGLLAALALLAGHAGGAFGMTMVRQGDTMVLTGPVDNNDGDQFRHLLAQGGPLARVILLGSPGGDSRAGFSVANQIRANHINTVVAGTCVSACAVIFMGGVERQMMGGKTLAQTRLGFHGPHTSTTKSLSRRGADELSDWLEKKSDGKFTGELLARATQIDQTYDMLFFYHPDAEPQAPGEQPPSVVFCPEAVRLRSQCQPFPGVDAVSAGVLTTRTLFAPDTPIYAAPK